MAVLSACAALPAAVGDAQSLPVSERMVQILETVKPVAVETGSESPVGEDVSADSMAGRIPISLEVVAVPARIVFRAMAALAGQDIVVDQGLSGNLSLELKGQSWLRAVRLAASSLGWHSSYDRQLALMRLTEKSCPPPECSGRQVLKVEHREARALASTLQQLGQDAGRLRVFADASSNSIVLSGDDSSVAEAVRLLRRLDRPRPVVLIEVWVLEIGNDSQRALGVDLGLSRRDLRGGLATEGDASLLRHSPEEATASVIGLSERHGLAVRLAALARQGYTRILSHPRIWVIEGEQAEIFQGDEVPYVVSTEQGGNHTQFRQAGLGLRVRPTIRQSGHVELDLEISKDTVDRSRANPPISRREMRTKLVMAPGEAALIGGISAAEETARRKGVPGLGAIGSLGEQGRGRAQLLVVLSATVPARDARQ